MKKCVSIPQHNEQRKTKSAYICCVHSHPYKLSTLKFLDTNERRRALVFERVTLYAICKGFRARQRGLFGPVMLLYMSLDALRSISSDNIVGSHNQNSAVWKKKWNLKLLKFFFAPVWVERWKRWQCILIVLHKSYGDIHTIRAWIMLSSTVNSKNIIQVWLFGIEFDTH